MNLIRTSYLSLIVTTVRILTALVLNKMISIYVGPSGLALIGQFQNFSQISLTIAQCGINKGVVKYTAEYNANSNALNRLYSTASKLSIASSLIVGSIVIVFSKYAAINILKAENFQFVFIIFGLTLIFFVLNGLILSILNGRKKIDFFTKANLLQSLYSLIFSTLLIFFFGLNGALVALVTNQSVVFFILLIMLKKSEILKLGDFLKPFDFNESKKLLTFATMTLVSALLSPSTHLYIRNMLITSGGLEIAGHWQAIWYISAMYFMVISTTMSTYFLPKLSELSDKKLIRLELLNGYKLLVPIVILLSLGMYYLRDLVIHILFTEDFNPVRELFFWQLLGDVLKFLSFLLSFVLLAKARVKIYVMLELIFNASFVAFSGFLIDEFGVVGVTQAYFVSYCIYIMLVFYSVKKELY